MTAPSEAEAEAASAFVLDRWRERAAERGDTEPVDLSGACKFAAAFAAALFGGTVEAHDLHAWAVVDGSVVHLAAGSADVAALRAGRVPAGQEEYAKAWGIVPDGDDPYAPDRRFTTGPGFREALEANAPRVDRWLDRWRAERGNA